MAFGGIVGQRMNSDDYVTKNNLWWKELTRFTTPGSVSWTCPNDGYYGIVVIGAGGAGASSVAVEGDTHNGYGGASGYAKQFIKFYSKNQTVSGTVGAKGKGSSIKYRGTHAGGNGGNSSFDGITAKGGQGGGSAFPANTYLSLGGINSFSGSKGFGEIEINPQMEIDLISIDPMSLINLFTYERFLGCGGSPGDTPNKNSENKGGGNGVSKINPSYNENTTGGNATLMGCGGGAARAYYSSDNWNGNTTGGNGADGGIIIYSLG